MKNSIAPITFSWYPWLPNGLLTMLVSYSGEGKSILAERISGVFSDGLAWPDGTPYLGQIGKVLWCEAESAQAINLDRAQKMGLNLENFITPFPEPETDVSLDNPIHQLAIAEKAHLPDVKFIVVDSLSGSTNKKENETEMKQVTEFLARLCRDAKKPMLLTHHLNKPGNIFSDVVTLERVRGSSAIVQFTRVVWSLDKPDINNKQLSRLSMIKNNLARFSPPLGYTIENDKIVFTDTAPTTPKAQKQGEKAADIILEMLKDGNQIKSSDIQKVIESKGISWATVKNIKGKLNIVASKKDDGWYWYLPAKEIKDETLL
jgi:hypothetical protein